MTSNQYPHPVCQACTAAERRVVLATDLAAHVQECHPNNRAMLALVPQPRHTKIRRTAV